MSDLLITDGEPHAPAPDAEVLSITVDNSLRDKGDGAFKIEVDDFADDKDDAQDVVIQDGGDIQSLEIAKIGKGDGEDDVFRLDLAMFDDDFLNGCSIPVCRDSQRFINVVQSRAFSHNRR